jgi:hypothetical protein
MKRLANLLKGPPNSTGAYELDVTLSNDFGHAWREMHVKTDVFCSAGLQLPDKAGRQMTIGGWSDIALSGIRLYTPDGAIGVNGTNDWIENEQEVYLQDGRWYVPVVVLPLYSKLTISTRYPSAVVMSNGNIMVVGGEDGSNGSPVPTIETLPPSGPPQYMDWLQQTDPWNLYPFLAVASSGVFVGYYNEARIIDETTFATNTVCFSARSTQFPPI